MNNPENPIILEILVQTIQRGYKTRLPLGCWARLQNAPTVVLISCRVPATINLTNHAKDGILYTLLQLKELPMKYNMFLSMICILVITSFFTLGCDRILKPTTISEIIAQTDDLPGDPDGFVPILPETAEIEPGRYRMRVGPGTYGEEDGKLYRIIFSVDDRAAGCVAVEILLNPKPKGKTADGKHILRPNFVDGESIDDAVVVEITAKRDVSPRLLPEEPELAPTPYFADPQEPCTVHVYDGRLIKNLSDPDVFFEYEDEVLIE